MKFISSSENQVIKLARSLHLKKYRDQENLFLAEGRRLVEEALALPDRIVALFIREELAGEFADRQDFACYVIDDKLLKHISMTETPQGMAAILRKPDWNLTALTAADSFLVLLNHLADPGNLGSIMRSCWALEVDGLLLTPDCVDPFNPKVVRSTMGAIFHLPLIEAVSDRQLDDLQAHGFELIATGLENAMDYYDIDLRGKKILVLGSEASGIDPALQRRCSQTARIPINPSVDSLNVAAACAIITAEAWRQRRT
ncbi:MAG TPA: RNA methyltransferase [Syntrophomonas sp.]|nr:RNA methyltransferase [Syntrophomonas sp.]HRW12004.1 RNA methyltransferase [Syntrophomonas sp.]